MDNQSPIIVQKSSLSFLSLLGLLFIGLKLGGAITWPWIWVLSPLWIGLVLFVTILLVVLGLIFLAFLISLLAKYLEKPTKKPLR